MQGNQILTLTSTSTSSSSSNNNDLKGSIAAIANRIQERANQLSQERNTLQSLEHDLSQSRKELDEQHSIHDTNREKLLIQTRNVHKHELEVIKHQRMIQRLHSKIESNTNVMEETQEQIHKIRKECEAIDSSVYAPHIYETAMYKRGIENKVQRLKAKRLRREQTLDRMRLETDRDREETISMEREARRLKDEIKMMEEVEIREDEEIAAVAMQIRATLAKVGSWCTTITALLWQLFVFIQLLIVMIDTSSHLLVCAFILFFFKYHDRKYHYEVH